MRRVTFLMLIVLMSVHLVPQLGLAKEPMHALGSESPKSELRDVVPKADGARADAQRSDGLRPEGREQVAMPYACEMHAGKPTLSTSAEQTYTLLSVRSEQPFTVCAPNDGRRCRTIMVHRFSMMCGNTKVAWMDVVANTPAPGFGSAFVDGSRFYMQPGRRFGALFDNPCSDGPATGSVARPGMGQGTGSGARQDFNAQRDPERCSGRLAPRRRDALIALPPGFAPLAEIGARIVLPGALPVSSQAPWPTSATAAATKSAAGEAAPDRLGAGASAMVAATNTKAEPTKIEPAKVELAKAELAKAEPSKVDAAGSTLARLDGSLAAIPLPVETPRVAELPNTTGVDPVASAKAPAAAPPASSAQRPRKLDMAALSAAPAAVPGWVTIVEPVMAASISAQAASPYGRLEQVTFMVIIGLAALSGLFWLTLGEAPWQFYGRTRGRAVSVRLANLQTFARAGLPDMEVCRDLSQSAVGLIDQVHNSIDSLAVAPPLKRVLARETRIVEQRLASLLSNEPKTGDAWRRLRLRVTQVVVDLTRLRDIGDGALKSLAGARKNADGPRDRAEAYEVLGVNPDINDRILKKLVEALRACWHPDLAKDDADRIEREHRIKQINVACDLISGKRQEAA